MSRLSHDRGLQESRSIPRRRCSTETPSPSQHRGAGERSASSSSSAPAPESRRERSSPRPRPRGPMRGVVRPPLPRREEPPIGTRLVIRAGQNEHVAAQRASRRTSERKCGIRRQNRAECRAGPRANALCSFPARGESNPRCRSNAAQPARLSRPGEGDPLRELHDGMLRELGEDAFPKPLMGGPTSRRGCRPRAGGWAVSRSCADRRAPSARRGGRTEDVAPSALSAASSPSRIALSPTFA